MIRELMGFIQQNPVVRKTSTSVVRLLAGASGKVKLEAWDKVDLVCFGKRLVHTYLFNKGCDFFERFKKFVMFADTYQS